MIKLTEQEIKWGVDSLKDIKFDIENKENIDDKSYLEFITSIGETTYKNCKYLLNNIDKINKNEEVNKKFIDTLDNLNGFWVWQDYKCKEKVKKYIDDEIFLDILQKIYWE